MAEICKREQEEFWGRWMSYIQLPLCVQCVELLRTDSVRVYRNSQFSLHQGNKVMILGNNEKAGNDETETRANVAGEVRSVFFRETAWSAFFSVKLWLV